MHRCNRHPEGRGGPHFNRFVMAGPFDGGGGAFGGRRRGGGFGGGDGLGGDGLGGGGRRAKRFAGDELRLMVLALLESGPHHGYQLIRTFADRSGEAYSPSPGVLYPLLTLLQDMGSVEEAPGEGRTRSFTLTEIGKAELDAGRERAAAALARLAAMAAQVGRTDAGPIRRAMMNLRAATMQRMGKGGDDQTAFAIAALLDEAAQKIERL